MNNLCSYPQLDETTLTWAGNVLTTIVDGDVTPVGAVKLSPCSGFKYNTAAFKVINNVITKVDATSLGKHTVNACGGALFDADVFTVEQGILGLKTEAAVPKPPVEKQTPTLETQSSVTEEDDSPTIELTSDKTFAASPSSDDLGADFGETGLSFSSATGGSTSCSVSTTGTATQGTIKFKAKPSAFDPSDNLNETAEVSITVKAAPPKKQTPTLSTSTKITEGEETPTIELTSDKTFAESPTKDDLGLDFGETALEFSSASGSSTSCTVETTGTAAQGTIKAKAKPSAFNPSDNLNETAEVQITVTAKPVVKETPTLSSSTKITAGDETPTIELTSDKTFAASPTEENLGIDWGETGLTFGSATGGSTTCSITTVGSASAGTIKFKAKPEAFDPSENLNETAEVTIEVTEAV